MKKTGIKLDVDDPIFALVALNEAVLADAVQRHVDRIDVASRDLAERARHAGGLPAAAQADAALAPPALPADRRTLAIAGGAAVLGAVLSTALVLLGQALWFRPAPPVTVPVPAPLTASQIDAIATGERLTRALPRLDAKTRAAVLAEMQKP